MLSVEHHGRVLAGVTYLGMSGHGCHDPSPHWSPDEDNPGLLKARGHPVRTFWLLPLQAAGTGS